MKAEYMAHSGSDLLVVDAARASFGKQSAMVPLDKEMSLMRVRVADAITEDRDPTDAQLYLEFLAKKENDDWMRGEQDPWVLKFADAKLVKFLAREGHLLPFRHPTITLRCKAPMFVARQLGKHQTGMSWSEESRRYIKTEPEFYWPEKWRKKADNVKQGSTDEEAEYEGYYVSGATTFSPEEMVAMMKGMYEEMLSAGVAPEQARMVLPQNMYITWVWTGTLLAWSHMIHERTAPTAQRETQEFAKMVRDVLKPLYPVSMEALGHE